MTAGWLRGVIRGGDSRSEPPQSPLVIKFGGSLLDRPAWPTELIGLLATTPLPAVLVVGGGRLVDALRRIDAASSRPPEVMHRLAIDALGLTARLVADALGLPLVTSPAPDRSAEGRRVVVLDTPAWLTAGEPPERLARLPVGWHVTSDSLAAVVAAEVGGRMMLVKSVAPPCPGDDLGALASAGWIDGYFSTAAASLDTIGWAAIATRRDPEQSVDDVRPRTWSR